MNKVFLKDIREKDQFESSFLVTKKESGISKTGKAYLNLRLMDSTGEIEGRVWDNAEALARNFKKSDVVAVKGFAVAYQGGLQLNVGSIRALSNSEYAIEDYLPVSKRPIEEMSVELDSTIASVKDQHIRALLKSVFEDPEIRERFLRAPAAKSMHHPYVGGLVEHVLSICGLAKKVASHYGEGINLDLVLAGAMLHDIGKLFELSFDGAFEYTDEGRLLGHITMGVELVEKKASLIKDFPQGLKTLIKHMILSHHGHLEFGSPKRPKTLEAIILYYLDDMDAKVKAIETLMEAEPVEDSRWSAYQKMFERYIFLGDRQKADDAPVEATRQSAPVENGPAERASGGKGPLSLF